MADFVLSQSISFLAFFCCGVCTAAFFDLFRIFRRLLSHSRWSIILEDLTFCFISGAMLFQLLFSFQSGRLRFFLPIAFLLGILLWLISFSRLFLGPVLRFLLFLKRKGQRIYKKLRRSKKNKMNNARKKAK